MLFSTIVFNFVFPSSSFDSGSKLSLTTSPFNSLISNIIEYGHCEYGPQRLWTSDWWKTGKVAVMIPNWAYPAWQYINLNILETLTKCRPQAHTPVISHMPRDIDVKYIASVETNKKLSAGRLHTQCNLIACQIGMPTASISKLKRRYLAPHSGHKNSVNYSN